MRRFSTLPDPEAAWAVAPTVGECPVSATPLHRCKATPSPSIPANRAD